MKVFKWDKIKYGDRIVTQSGDKNVILHNVNNNKTVKVSKEVFDVIDEICKSGWKIEDVFEKCETQADREILLDNLIYLSENEIIREINDFSEYKEMDIRIDWDITNRCNLRCRHCCVCADIKQFDLEKKDIFEIVDKIISLNPIAITISGGEPLIRSDFTEIITKLREKYHGYVQLMTNAILIDDKMAEFISENINAVSVSLDGVDEETCRIVRGEGVFNKAIQGIKRLQKAGMDRISASMVITSATYKYKKRFIDMCKEMGVEPFLRELALVGRAKEELRDMLPDENNELEYECSEISKKEQIKKIRKSETKLKKIPLFSCGAAYKQFQIDFQGNIYPCQSLMDEELLLGNICHINNFDTYIRERLFKTTEGYKNLEQYFPYNFKECKGCNKQIFCWNCVETIYRNKRKLVNCFNSCILDKYWE